MKRFPLSKLTCMLIMLLSLVLMTAQAASAASLNDSTWKIVKFLVQGENHEQIFQISQYPCPGRQRDCDHIGREREPRPTDLRHEHGRRDCLLRANERHLRLPSL